MQRVDRSEYEEWRKSVVTEDFFNFLRLEAELTRRYLASGEARRDTEEDTGRTYNNLLLQAEIYERIAEDTQYEDLYPLEELKDETSQES